MAHKQENPVISATIYYYDTLYSSEVAVGVLEILKRNQFYPPHKIHAGTLSKDRFVLADSKTSELFIQAYSEKDVFGVDMASGDSRTSTEYWRVDWGFTYYKNSKLTGSCQLQPWNTFTLQSTYRLLQDPVAADRFLNCVKELISFLSPFYASIDDLSKKVLLTGRTAERHFVPDKVQTVFWGNYWGPAYCQRYDVEQILHESNCDIDYLAGGVLFTLSNSLLDNQSRIVERTRKKIMQRLKKAEK